MGNRWHSAGKATLTRWCLGKQDKRKPMAGDEAAPREWKLNVKPRAHLTPAFHTSHKTTGPGPPPPIFPLTPCIPGDYVDGMIRGSKFWSPGHTHARMHWWVHARPHPTPTRNPYRNPGDPWGTGRGQGGRLAPTSPPDGAGQVTPSLLRCSDVNRLSNLVSRTWTWSRTISAPLQPQFPQLKAVHFCCELSRPLRKPQSLDCV